LGEYQPEIRLRISGEKESEETFQALHEIFAAHHGTAMVYLQLVEKRKLIKTQPKFWLDPSPAAVEKLEALLGKGAVQFQ